jgi:hypothetical protein
LPLIPRTAGDLVQVDPLRGREHGTHVLARRDQDERLRHLFRPDPERGGLVNRPLRVRVLQHVEVDPSLLKETRHVCHRSSFPSQSSLVSIARASRARQRLPYDRRGAEVSIVQLED